MRPDDMHRLFESDFDLEAIAVELEYLHGSSSKFVKKEDLSEVRKQIKNYERMKQLVDIWIELAMELSILRIANPKN